MKKCIGVIIPTYNERENIIPLIEKLSRVLSNMDLKHYIVIIDDNSPDGTADVVKEYARDKEYINLIVRPGKMGLGSALKTGLEKLFENPCITHFVTIDADFSHNPDDLTKMLSNLNEVDVVIGSRYVEGGEIIGWGFRRKLISKVANIVIKTLYRTGLRDHTNNYRVYSRKAVEYILKYTTTSSYEWVIESLLVCKAHGLKIVEKPIIFINRKKGVSKLRIIDIIKWLLFVTKYRSKFNKLRTLK